MTFTTLFGFADPGLPLTEASYQSIEQFFGEGVSRDVGNACQVVASTPAAMSVEVQTGRLLCGGVHGEVTSQDLLSISPADPGLARVDRIVCRRDNSANTLSLLVLTGTPASSPTAPPLTRTGDIYEISLARVAVAAGATSIEAGDVTDERSDPTVCGMIAPHQEDHATRHQPGGADEIWPTALEDRKDSGTTLTTSPQTEASITIPKTGTWLIWGNVGFRNISDQGFQMNGTILIVGGSTLGLIQWLTSNNNDFVTMSRCVKASLTEGQQVAFTVHKTGGSGGSTTLPPTTIQALWVGP